MITFTLMSWTVILYIFVVLFLIIYVVCFIVRRASMRECPV